MAPETDTRSLLAKLKAGSKNFKIVPWPGTDEEVRLRILNEQDYLESSEATDRLFAGRHVAAENITDYESEKATQQLFRAIEDPKSGKAITGNITEFRRLLTSEIKEALYDEFKQFADECDPHPSRLTDDEFDELFNSVKKNSKQISGNVSSIFIARRLIVALVEELSK